MNGVLVTNIPNLVDDVEVVGEDQRGVGAASTAAVAVRAEVQAFVFTEAVEEVWFVVGLPVLTGVITSFEAGFEFVQPCVDFADDAFGAKVADVVLYGLFCVDAGLFGQVFRRHATFHHNIDNFSLLVGEVVVRWRHSTCF